jgi:hypothetical protein
MATRIHFNKKKKEKKKNGRQGVAEPPPVAGGGHQATPSGSRGGLQWLGGGRAPLQAASRATPGGL